MPYNLLTVNGPLSIREALHSKDANSWKILIDAEVEPQRTTNTWKLAFHAEGNNILTINWVFEVR